MTRHFLYATCFLVLAAAPRVRAQQEGPPSELSAMLGASNYHFPGDDTGTGPSLTVGLTLPLNRRTLFLEPSLSFLRFTTEFGHHSTWMFPELTLQAQQHLGGVRPYLGVGLGTGTVGLSGPTHWKFTMLALGGARVRLSGRWGVRGEVRVRSVDPWKGRTADFNLGIVHTSF